MLILSIVIIAITPIAVAVAWWWEAQRAAKLRNQAFEPKPASPTQEDSQALRDARLQAEWRRRVQENIERRAKDKPLPSLLRRQAE